jgi:hypothetical protein
MSTQAATFASGCQPTTAKDSLRYFELVFVNFYLLKIIKLHFYVCVVEINTEIMYQITYKFYS